MLSRADLQLTARCKAAARVCRRYSVSEAGTTLSEVYVSDDGPTSSKFATLRATSVLRRAYPWCIVLRMCFFSWARGFGVQGARRFVV
jgi:hypothetical protein